MVKRVCLVSSGSGGHLMPVVALAGALQRGGHEVLLLTGGRAVEQAMLERCTQMVWSVPTASLHIGRTGPTLPWRLLQATLAARRYLVRQKVDLLVGAGGRTTVAAGLAAHSLGLPIYLLEQNVVAGRANRLLLPFARRLYFGLPPRRKLRRGLLTGTPLRPRMGEINKTEARRGLGLEADGLLILVTGGSQGARVLNEIVPAALTQTRGGSFQVIHLSGPEADEPVRQSYNRSSRLQALVRPMAMDMAVLYAAADLVICRAGGGTIAELMVVGRPSILVPYPHHRDRQQYHNSSVLKDAGAAIVCEQKDFTVQRLITIVEDLLAKPERLLEMGRRAAALALTDPCARILLDLEQNGAFA